MLQYIAPFHSFFLCIAKSKEETKHKGSYNANTYKDNCMQSAYNWKKNTTERKGTKEYMPLYQLIVTILHILMQILA